MPRKQMLSRDYANLALGGKLDALLKGWRDDDKTIDEIVPLLAEKGIKTSRETVRRWLNEAAA